MLPKDPNMLLSVINTKLRDKYKNIDEFAEDLNVNKEEIFERLRAIGYEYDIQLNRFV